MPFSHNLFSKIDGRNIDLLITISSDAVHASLYYFADGEAPRLLAHTHKNLAVTTDMSLDKLHDEMLHVLPELCDDIARKSQVIYELPDLLIDHQRIHHVIVLLSSPWTGKQTRQTDSKTAEAMFTVSTEDIAELIKTDIPQGRTKIDTFVASGILNGYSVPTAEIVGQKTQSLTLSVIDTFARFDHVETIFQIIQTKFNINEEEISVRPFSSAMFTGLSSIMSVESDRTVLYMHAQYMDVFVFNNNNVVAHSAVEYGYQDILEQLQKNNVTQTPAQTHSLLEMYLKGHLEQSVHDTITEIIDIELRAMRNILEEEITEVSQNVYVPHDWYVVSDSELAHVFVKKMKKEYQDNRIHIVNPNHTTDVIDTDQSDRATTGVLLSGMYIDSVRNQPQE